ncbi:MAG: hypothetical protein GF308_19030 [Candidatus Heimdallarchaeota archaeon]|nr:hypothetical protein [Candidatus Heimdallarchaeota archaeon]
MRIQIFCEDAYGKLFFKKLLERLKREEVISAAIGFDVKRLPALCNPKITRAIKAVRASKSPEAIILIYDGDSEPSNVEEKIRVHIPPPNNNIISLLIFETEIEELICHCEGRRISSNRKPSEELKTTSQYKKSRLPQYADSLNLERLQEHELIQDLIALVENSS